MDSNDFWRVVADHIATATGTGFDIVQRRPVGGGCINDAYVVSAGDERYFIKLNQAARQDMFAAEAEGLNEIVGSHSVRVPRPLIYGAAAGRAFLVMEYLDLGGRGRDGAAQLGRQLALMHQTRQQHFGWRRDNTIGSTTQVNTPATDWAEFWLDRRLRFQFDLAAQQGYRGRLQQHGERLMMLCRDVLVEHGPEASLLHGDLWSGNYARTVSGEPVIFDPAVYYGDRETDLAMTELFGGFPRAFYDAYQEAWPLPGGYALRRTLYNLYHILNHLNLFGAGYQAQAEQMIDQLLGQLGHA